MVSRGGGVSKSATKASRGGIGREEKRGISTILLARSGSIRAFVADLDNPPARTGREGRPRVGRRAQRPSGQSRRTRRPRRARGSAVRGRIPAPGPVPGGLAHPGSRRDAPTLRERVGFQSNAQTGGARSTGNLRVRGRTAHGRATGRGRRTGRRTRPPRRPRGSATCASRFAVLFTTLLRQLPHRPTRPRIGRHRADSSGPPSPWVYSLDRCGVSVPLHQHQSSASLSKEPILTSTARELLPTSIPWFPTLNKRSKNPWLPVRIPYGEP